MASSVEWDPTGRFVVTSVSAWRQKLETVRLVPCHSHCCVDVFDVVFVQGMNLYTFHGQKVHSVLRDMFYQVICF